MQFFQWLLDAYSIQWGIHWTFFPTHRLYLDPLHPKYINVCSNIFILLKGIKSRICWLLFVHATFKVGPSSSAQSILASGGPTYLRSGKWLLHFYWVLHLTPCVLLLAGGYTPLPKGWYPETSRAQQNKKIQAECRISADTDHHTLLVSHNWWLRGIIFVMFESKHSFLGKSYSLYLSLSTTV